MASGTTKSLFSEEFKLGSSKLGLTTLLLVGEVERGHLAQSTSASITATIYLGT